MNRSQIKKLALSSYKNDKLDLKRIDEIVDILKKSELKQFIKDLKTIEKKKSIIVVLPNEENKSFYEKELKKVYGDRKITYQYDPELVLGIKIIDNDLIYEYNLKDTIDQITGCLIK